MNSESKSFEEDDIKGYIDCFIQERNKVSRLSTIFCPILTIFMGHPVIPLNDTFDVQDNIH